MPRPVRGLFQPLPLIIGLQSITAGRTEIQAEIKIIPCQPGIGPSRGHFVKKIVRLKRTSRGAQHNVLAQNIAWPIAPAFPIKIVLLNGLQSRLALDDLKPVCRHQNGL